MCRLLDKVNGETVTSLTHLARIYGAERAGEYFVFEFSKGGDKIVLNSAACREIEAQVKETHAIPDIASEELQSIVARPAAEASGA